MQRSLTLKKALKKEKRLFNDMNKKHVLGQYFTKREIANRVIKLILKYKSYEEDIEILEPSSGTGNFIKELNNYNFDKIDYCEIDPSLVKEPKDFFTLPLEKKYDLIIGNPPFSKFNIKESFFYPSEYSNSLDPSNYLTEELSNKKKMKIENAFILKSINHLKNEDSSIGFVLPISFFIESKNNKVKKELLERFSTIIIYQNDKDWFEEKIPCCFAVFTNVEDLKNKVLLLYENEEEVVKKMNISSLLNKELIPKTFIYKENNHIEGKKLNNYIMSKSVSYKKSYDNNNISASNILKHCKIPKEDKAENYYLAVARVGNSSVGRAGLINIEEDVLNDMFYVFKFEEKYKSNKKLKEKICKLINKNQDYFKNITCRVGSKSIKKKDILDFKLKI